MEKQHISRPNKIQISSFGAVFLRQLPQQTTTPNASTGNYKQNGVVQNSIIKRRGEGINFQQFANHTQVMIHHEIRTLFRVQTEASEVNQFKRKQILHHNNWINEQRLIKHKLSDVQARIEQTKFSEYDWKKQSQSLKKTKFDILHEWQTAHQTSEKRMMGKLKSLNNRKYPNRSESGLIRLSVTKKLK